MPATHHLTTDRRQPADNYGDDVQFIEYNDKVVILVGTAHISQNSVDLVKTVIEHEQPDSICLELDERRFQALTDKKQWQALDLRSIIKNKQLSTLLISLLMASYQKRLGSKMGVIPGAELLMAIETAHTLQIPLFLCDRDIRITLRRAWKATSFLKKNYLLASLLLSSVFDKDELNEEKLTELKKKDVLGELMSELGDTLPDLKKVLIDERDMYLVEKIKASPGKKIVAVVGAGHLEGMARMFSSNNQEKLVDISTIPPVSIGYKALAWGVPLIIISSLATIFWQKGSALAGESVLYWILANGIPTAIGSLLSLAHPLTTISAFAASPLTSLSPLIGAGYVCAFVQVMTCPPRVGEIENSGHDAVTVTGWWKNRLLRVFLVFFLTGFGSALGTWIGGYKIFTNLFG
jgi:pheromone shutdown-related protein TraB